MKKPTNPLPSDLRYGGFLVLPILAAFQGQSNVVTPNSLALRAGLAEPLASWTIHAVHAMGASKPVEWGCEARHHVEIHNLPNKKHFVQRLSRSRAKELIEHVLSNAQAANASPSSEFSFDMIGVFGSVLHDSSAPGDVDIVYEACFKRTGAIIPESDYYPFSRDMPTDRAERVLRRGARQADVNCHDLREVHSIGAGYQVIWTREEGRVERMVAATKNAPDPEAAGEDGLLKTDAKCEAFRRACSDSSPLLPPIELQLPADVRVMTFRAWARMLREEKLVTLLAHCYCSHPGPIKTFLEDLIGKWRVSDPAKVASAERKLLSFLAASARFGTWKWNPTSGLVKGKPYRQRELFRG